MTSSAMLDPAIVKEHATEDDPWAKEWMARNVASGSGPYKIVSHIPDQEIVLEAWDGYLAGKAPIERMIWKIIPSAAQRALLLRTGDIDIAEGLGEEEIKSLEGVDGVQIVKAPSGTQVYYGMNSSIAPFDDVLVRRAVSYAINYDDIIQNVYNGDAGRLWGPLSETSGMSLGESAGYKQDVAKAKELLESSSYNGETVTISIDSSKADRELIAVRVQAAMRAIGINADIERVTPAVYSERKVGKTLQSTVDGMLAWIDDPNYSLSLVLECGVYGNYMDYCNEEVDAIIKAGGGESAKDKRRAMFNRAQESGLLTIESLDDLADSEFEVRDTPRPAGYACQTLLHFGKKPVMALLSPPHATRMREVRRLMSRSRRKVTLLWIGDLSLIHI